MRLRSADGRDARGVHRRCGRARAVKLRRRLPRQRILRAGARRDIRRGQQRVAVRRDLRYRQCHLLQTTRFRYNETIPLMDRQPSAQIRQSEIILPITAIGGANEIEERLVFTDRDDLPFAGHPACRGKVPREHAYFTNVRLSHEKDLGWGWKDALEGDAEVDRQKRLHIQVRLTPARICDRGGPHRHEIGRRCVAVVHGRQPVARGHIKSRWIARRLHQVRVLRQFRNRERMRLRPGPLAQCVTAAHMDRRAALKIRQGEVHPPVTAKGRAQQGEKRLILIDREELPIAQRPASRGKVE